MKAAFRAFRDADDGAMGRRRPPGLLLTAADVLGGTTFAFLIL